MNVTMIVTGYPQAKQRTHQITPDVEHDEEPDTQVMFTNRNCPRRRREVDGRRWKE